MSQTKSPRRADVPFLDLKTPHRELAGEILAVWERLLRDAAFIGGAEVEGFEREFADWVGCRHAVGTSSGTSALRLALLALGLQPGDEVITAPNTFIATTEAISQAGGRPVFADVDDATGTIDPAAIEAKLTERTRILVPVHLYGQPADMAPIRELADRRGLGILEDAAQAHGATYHGARAGTLGDAAAFSFYPGKNLGACGDAGAVTTSRAEIAQRLRVLRDHGQERKNHHPVEGTNARLDALQAAALRIKLPHVDGWNEQRRAVAERYRLRLSGSTFRLPREAAGRRHVYHLYVIRHSQRDRLRERLSEAGVGTALHYGKALHLQPAYEKLGQAEGSFPHAESWAGEGLSLPLFPGMTEAQIDAVCDLLVDAARQD